MFVSFDYDYDADLKNALVGQAKMDDSPFEIADWSIKEASTSWKSEARGRIKRAEQVIVICGERTHIAKGVGIELDIAKDEGKPYFLLKGDPARLARNPAARTTPKCTDGPGRTSRN